MRPMKDNPCYGCKPPKRQPGCHATCPDYIIAKAFHMVEQEEIRKQKEATQYSIDTARNNKDRSQKRKKDFKGYSWRHC